MSVKNSTCNCPECMFIPSFILRPSRDLHISQSPSDSTRTSPDSHPIFISQGLRPPLRADHTSCTSVIHPWHSPMGWSAQDRARDWPAHQAWLCHGTLHINFGVSSSLPHSCIPRALSPHPGEAFSLWCLWIWWHWQIYLAYSFVTCAQCEAENRICSWASRPVTCLLCVLSHRWMSHLFTVPQACLGWDLYKQLPIARSRTWKLT